MELTTSSNTLSIAGNIKSVNDFQAIKTAANEIIAKNSEISIVIENSLSITSSIIGYFNKLVLKDGIKINMRVGNPQLMELLEDLSLTSIFNVRSF
ncbi:MAG: hypothetical protein U9O86_04295 [Campylobacterota bacterium]|nr:hypothetical protein [Campylobacterota bacterium]